MTFILRGLLVLVSWGIAVGIPRFELCLALVGSLTTTVLAFILPPLFHLKLMWKDVDMKLNVFHALLLALGIFITVGATSINLYMAIKDKGGSTPCKKFEGICTKGFLNEYDHCYTVVD
jgi:proton-coupled amino acid transporter